MAGTSRWIPAVGNNDKNTTPPNGGGWIARPLQDATPERNRSIRYRYGALDRGLLLKRQPPAWLADVGKLVVFDLYRQPAPARMLQRLLLESLSLIMYLLNES